jgi:hypothetical protein
MTSIGLRHSGLKRQSLTKALQLDPVLPQNFARLLRCACASVPPFRSITLIDPTLSESQVTERDEYPEHEPPLARGEAAQAHNRAVGSINANKSGGRFGRRFKTFCRLYTRHNSSTKICI